MKSVGRFIVSLAVVVVMSLSVAEARRPKHVVFIGLDGWGSYSMSKVDMPNVKALMDMGAWTLRSVAFFRRAAPLTGLPYLWA